MTTSFPCSPLNNIPSSSMTQSSFDDSKIPFWESISGNATFVLHEIGFPKEQYWLWHYLTLAPYYPWNDFQVPQTFEMHFKSYFSVQLEFYSIFSTQSRGFEIFLFPCFGFFYTPFCLPAIPTYNLAGLHSTP